MSVNNSIILDDGDLQMKLNQISQNRKGASNSMASMGLTMALGSIFVLGIGIPVTTSVISDNNLTGLTATVVGFAPVVIAGAYLYLVANMSGIIKAK